MSARGALSSSALFNFKKSVYNWGIVGCGKISWDFTNCLLKHPRCNVIACGARSLEASQKFANTFDIPIAYENYDNIAKNEEIDVVYIGTYHPSHFPNVIKCLESGKHVICEKPIGINAKQVKKMVDCAKNQKRFLMEAVWTRFFPATRKIRSIINDKNIFGKPHTFIADFGINYSNADTPTLWQNKMAGGGTLDLGIYTVAPLTMYFGARMPLQV